MRCPRVVVGGVWGAGVFGCRREHRRPDTTMQPMLACTTRLRSRARTAGNGRILDWTVTADPDGDTWEYSHLHPDGRLGHTAPAACFEHRRDVPTGGGEEGFAPAIHASNKASGSFPGWCRSSSNANVY